MALSIVNDLRLYVSNRSHWPEATGETSMAPYIVDLWSKRPI
jgi:hypothetical protein